MKRETRKYAVPGGCFLAAFVLWTVLLCFADHQAIGPQGSAVGFAGLNGYVHRLTGVHMALYDLTDRLSLIPLLTASCFGILGLSQWIKRKQLRKVDFSILVLGGFYVVVCGLFLFFETCVINYRPILIGGILEASYPSSTTVLVLCVMPTAGIQLHSRIRNSGLRCIVTLLIGLFTAFMIVARLVSGVHWITDIIGGMLLSAGLVFLYRAICRTF